MIVTLACSACARTTDPASAKIEPARVEPLEDTGLNRLVLTAEAEQRLGIRTDTVGELATPGGQPPARVVPEAALIYETTGQTLVYTRTGPQVFVRHPVTVERIQGGLAVLRDGPGVGTAVVTVGASELFGIEFGIGK
ncbi:MAG: hypothetical protein ACRD0C_10105 [Acidimicrobiia bacterium]